MVQKTNRGLFRNVSMNKLDKLIENFYWDKEKSKFTYSYPLPSDHNLLEIGQQIAASPTQIARNRLKQYGPFLTTDSPNSHVGPFRHAIDFLIPDGTPVLATRAGIIIEVQETSITWGDGPKFRDYLNYLTIRHDGENTEYSQYCHLQANSVSNLNLQVGSTVSQGQPIGVVGKSGWTDRDHLHFIVYKSDKNPHGFKSLVPNFK